MWAHDLADLVGARLELLAADIRRSAEESPDTAAELEAEEDARLARWAARRELDAAELATTERAPDRALAAEAEQVGAIAVVIGSQVDEGVTSLGVGSLAHRLAHHVGCPLIVVPPGPTPLRGATVVIGIDGSRGSEQALRWGIEVARRIGGTPVAVCAIDSMYETYGSAGYYGREEQAARHQWRAVAPDVELVEPLATEPAAALGEIADERDAGLIVVAARTRHSLGGLLLGAVPDRLLHHPTRPVAVLPHGFELPTDHAAAAGARAGT